MPHAADGVALAASLAEILGALFVAAVAAGCHRSYPRSHLASWAWSWLAGGAAMAISVVAAMLAPRPPLSVVAAVAILVLRYLQIGTLVAGVHAHRRAAASSVHGWRVVVGGALALGLVSAALPLPPGPWRSAVRSLLPAATLGGALFWSGIVLWHRLRPLHDAGSRLVAGTLVLYGIDRLHSAALSLNVLLGGRVFGYSLVLGFVGFALLAALGFGLVLALLEDEHRERERADEERRRRTEELEREKERLRVSEEKFAKVFQSSPDAITISAPWDGGRIVDVNRASSESSGTPRRRWWDAPASSWGSGFARRIVKTREAVSRGAVDAAVPLDRLGGAILCGVRRPSS